MKFLVLFKTSSNYPYDRIAAWIERELRDETVAVDTDQARDNSALQHYMEWCDKAVIVGPFSQDTIVPLADKPVLRLFADGAGTSTTLFFDKPENAGDQETKSRLIQRLQLFKRYK